MYQALPFIICDKHRLCAYHDRIRRATAPLSSSPSVIGGILCHFRCLLLVRSLLCDRLFLRTLALLCSRFLGLNGHSKLERQHFVIRGWFDKKDRKANASGITGCAAGTLYEAG